MSPLPERTRDGKRWVRVCRATEVSERHGLRVELDIETDLALFKVDGAIYATTNVCPHKREASIYNGFVSEGKVTCPMHDWTFDIRTGENIARAGGLKCFSVLEEDGFVWVAVESI